MPNVDPDKLTAALDVERLNLPAKPRIRRIVWEPYTEWLGDPALQVWAVLDDKTPSKDRSWKRLEPIERAIRKALHDLGEERFPHIRYWTVSELRRHRNAR